jgi:hypothetical protein
MLEFVLVFGVWSVVVVVVVVAEVGRWGRLDRSGVRYSRID